ncbi:MAG: phosphatidate cytidylyltransferase, partial [Planctomycetota bacterium]
MLRQRIQTSAILIGFTVPLLLLDAYFPLGGAPGLWLLPLLLTFSLGTARDVSKLLQRTNRKIWRPGTMIATAIVCVLGFVPMFWPLFGEVYPPDCSVGRAGWIVVGAVAAVFFGLICELLRYGDAPAGALDRTLSSVFVSIYVGIPLTIFAVIRGMYPEGAQPEPDANVVLSDAAANRWGMAALLTLIIVTKMSDIGAYAVGKLIGRHKMTPRLSPNKTWEGAAGGVMFSTIAAWLCLHVMFPLLCGDQFSTAPSWGWLILGPVLGISGMYGDLAESLIKRDAGAKDSGDSLPGLGGYWDVTDSLIASSMPGF